MERLNISAHHIDAREIRARLDTPAVRMLADRGVPFDLIKETLEHRLRTTGDDFASLAEFYLAIEDTKKRRSLNRACNASADVLSPVGNELSSHETEMPSSVIMPTAPANNTITMNMTRLRNNSEQLTARTAGHIDPNTIRRENVELREARQCKLCLDREIDVVMLPCGHACTCVSCVTALTHCAICRQFIRGTVKIAME